MSKITFESTRLEDQIQHDLEASESASSGSLEFCKRADGGSPSSVTVFAKKEKERFKDLRTLEGSLAFSPLSA